MTSYELIDRLCCITETFAEIVREQAEIIIQSDIPKETKHKLEKKMEKADSELDAIEYSLRRII